MATVWRHFLQYTEYNVFCPLPNNSSYQHLTLDVPIPDKKKKLHFYFHTSLWCLRRFYEGLKDLHKTFWGTTKKCENKNVSYIYFNKTFWNAQDWKG